MTKELIMQRKIIIGVDLSSQLKKRLMQRLEKWKGLPVRWSKEENLHLVLLQLGYLEDEIVYDVCNKISKIVDEMEVFDIDLNKIELGPTNDKNAKLVRFSGEESERLRLLCEKIEKELGIFNANKKVFRPNIILGRIQRYGWQKLKEVPEINEKFDVLLPIDRIQVIESALIEGKRKFTPIESCELKWH